jgi:hypothetical protein
MKKLLTLAALVGVSGVANAAPAAATLTGVTTYSANGSVALNISTSTATWEVDTATGVATQTGGTFKGSASVGKTPLYTQTMTGGVLSSGAATASSWGCAEGIFGGIVGAHICGNFTFGGNGTNDSTVGNSGTAVTVTIGGDDVASGAPQSLANSYSNMTLTDLGGGNWRLSNSTGTSGYDFDFNVAAAAVPAAVDDDGGDVLEGVGKDINVGANDTDFTDPVTISLIAPDPTKGTAVVNTGTGNAADVTITYTASAGQTGTDTFGYQITDGTATETATVTVNILAFGANDDNYATTRGVALTGLTPAVNDTGYDPDTVTITAGACTSGDGTIAVTAGNGGPKAGVLVTYTPPANNPASGDITTLNDSCEYTIGNGDEPDTTANILVTVTNSVPVAADGDASAISTAGVAPTGPGLTATFTSPGTGGSLGNAGVTAIETQGTRGTAAVVGNVITYTVTDASFFAGSDIFTYSVTDADGDASDEFDTGTVTVTIADVEPTIADGAITTAADTASAATALTITAGNGSPAQHTLAVTTDGTNGSCTLSAANATGTVTYTPDAGYTGTDSCELTLTDGNGDTDTATINVTVEAEDEITLPGGSSSMDLLSLSLLGSLPLLMRRRRRS